MDDDDDDGRIPKSFRRDTPYSQPTGTRRRRRLPFLLLCCTISKAFTGATTHHLFFFPLFFSSVIFWAQGSRHGETLGTGTGTGSEKKLLSGVFLCCHDDQGVQGLVCCCVSQWQLYGQYLFWWQERTSLYEAGRMNRIEMSFGDTQCLICMCECEMSAGCQNSHGVSCFPRQELTPIALWRLAWRGGGGKQGQTHIIRCRQNRGKVEGEST